ncbi:hypothetical protein DFH28DRAFT_953279, partial [Melampsora americana]
SEYLVSKGHADRGGQECEKKILALVEWFRHTNLLRPATGKGNQYAPVKFTVSKEDLSEFKWNKRRAKKGEEEEGSLQVRILCRYQPSASPLAYRDLLGDQFQNSTSLPNVQPSQSPTGSGKPYTWEDTPPCPQTEDNLPNSLEQAPPSISQVTHSKKPS